MKLTETIQIPSWTLHGKALRQLYSDLGEAVPWKQYQRVFKGGKYRETFERAKEVSKSKRVHAIADKGLALCAVCEATPMVSMTKEWLHEEDDNVG